MCKCLDTNRAIWRRVLNIIFILCECLRILRAVANTYRAIWRQSVLYIILLLCDCVRILRAFFAGYTGHFGARLPCMRLVCTEKEESVLPSNPQLLQYVIHETYERHSNV